MSALRIENTLETIETHMSVIAPYRKTALFREFLVQGYRAVTLSDVPPEQFLNLLEAKLCLGTLITLYDDFADRPSRYNPDLLEKLYELGLQRGPSGPIKGENADLILNFASILFARIEEVLSRQPHYKTLREILNFDLRQFYSANRYSSLLMLQPGLHCSLENRLYTHHNMGMVIVFMMDLMSIEKLELSELGAIREVFLMGQRAGRIFNVLTTRQRELEDGDITGELAAYQSAQEVANAKLELQSELQELYRKIELRDTSITSFSVKHFLEGLRKLRKLHEIMEGTL